jgi:LmbE family N-acetylglucosaminyl deacetylase
MFSLQKQRLLVIAPHPDDEVLGCGGLIQKIKQNKGHVYVLFLTVGDTQDFSQKGRSSIKEREREIKRVAKYLNIDEYAIAFPGDQYHLKLELLGRHQLMQYIERTSPVSLERVKPTIVLIPSPYSYNQDHVIAATAAHTSLRPTEPLTKHFVRNVLAFEVPSDAWSLQKQQPPNFFLPLTPKEIKIKSKALRLYSSQYRPPLNPRSPEAIETLAALRGTQCQSPYAEAYHVYRITV